VHQHQICSSGEGGAAAVAKGSSAVDFVDEAEVPWRALAALRVRAACVIRRKCMMFFFRKELSRGSL
jgi:hypothetical protein